MRKLMAVKTLSSIKSIITRQDCLLPFINGLLLMLFTSVVIIFKEYMVSFEVYRFDLGTKIIKYL